MIKRSPFQAIAFFSAVLIGLALLMPARAFATGSADSIERWNIAMTDFSAGLPLFDLTPLDAVKSATHPNNAGYTSVDAAVAAAAHDVLVAEFGIFFGPNTPFESVYTAELAAISAGSAKNRGIDVGQAAAAAMLASRANEDVLGALNAPYTPGTQPGDYQPTPPTNFVSAFWARPACLRAPPIRPQSRSSGSRMAHSPGIGSHARSRAACR